MKHKIYVGNYPLNFTKEDVLNLFQDYEGIELTGFFKNEYKCYSFLLCLDEHQLVEIVASLHDIDVCGRNLIVRAADQKFHKRIQKSMLEHGIVSVHPKNTCDINSSTSWNENNKTFTSSEGRHFKESVKPIAAISENKSICSKKNEMSTSTHQSTMPNTYNYPRRITEKYDGISKNYENPDSFPNFPTCNSSQQASFTPQTCSNTIDDKSPNNYCQNISEFESEKSVLCLNPQETFSKLKTNTSSAHYKTINERFDSYKRGTMLDREKLSSIDFQTTNLEEQNKRRSRNCSESSLETVHNIPSFQQHENLSFISVMNFPLQLPIRNLYELFADFQPLKIFVVCNEPRKDKTPTEAIICFEDEKDATEAILTLDNTVYRGRILLVTDAVDRSMISELLSFG